jgi:hypothetical protein
MKWGSLYGPHHVNRLARGVARQVARPHRFVCLTDDPNGLEVEALPIPDLNGAIGADTRWRKLALWRSDLPEILGSRAPALFLDLDLVVVGGLDAFFEHPGVPGATGGGVMILRDDDLFRPKPLRRSGPPATASSTRWATRRCSASRRAPMRTCSTTTSPTPRRPARASRSPSSSSPTGSSRGGRWDYWPRGWCASFKNDCVPRGPLSYVRDPAPPPGARVVVFAGSPKMDEVLAGGGHRPHRRIGDVGWLREAWEG